MWRCRRDRSQSSGGCPRPALGGRRRCRSPSRLPARARRRRRRHPETRARRNRRRQQPWRRLGRRQAPSRSHPDRAAYQGRRRLCDVSGQTRSPTARVPRARRAVRGATRSPTRSRGRIPAPRRPRRRSGRPGLRWTSAACSAAASAAASSGLTGIVMSGPAAETHQLGVGAKAAVRTVDRRQLGGDHGGRCREPVGAGDRHDRGRPERLELRPVRARCGAHHDPPETTTGGAGVAVTAGGFVAGGEFVAAGGAEVGCWGTVLLPPASERM